MNKEEAVNKATTTFNSAADYFDAPALCFWNRFGRRTIELADLQSGMRVLDVCCGTGASAIPAAIQVGATGSVLGVDLANALLELARKKSQQQGLTNIEFQCADFTNLDLPSASFDAIVCVFGIFFLPDMEAAVAELWRMLLPGGILAITSWGARVFEPANQTFWSAIATERPDLYKQFTPWYRIGEPASLQALVASCGANNVKVVAETDSHHLASPEDWWLMVMGGGTRGTIDKLEPVTQERVKSVCLEFLTANNIQALDSDVLYAIARK
ncbi:class I SAM-dependent methyltransferase [Chamaesiphon minutus]|uniref:Methylase involved in ubiquinone/menaquinone biosynthesis n=1 Tax=Chamaesiphon minutus (strain ATCC 27169 / PCC 6605) TaxID=1173020 RepID=K9UL27_CHAP6|nr:methyltransferase domain-containing protein [Chamaesiphon minutus]AFY95535.1 methylase involved in ubiquinone/menaquinone biosynthesis [Chamaesiphon minutus PCC 6605]